MIVRKNYILGGSLTGLAATWASRVPLLDEGIFGGNGREIAYYVVPRGKRLARRSESAAWTDAGADKRAYQFWATGLPEVRGEIAINFLRRYSDMAWVAFRTACATYDGSKFEVFPAHDVTPRCIPLDGPRIIERLATESERAVIRNNFGLAEIDLVKHELHFEHRSKMKYDTIVSTLPLDRVAELVPDLKGLPKIALDMQMLNVGMVLSQPVPISADIHRLDVVRNGTALCDGLDFYSHIDSRFLPELNDGKTRFAIAFKHIVGVNELPLSPDSFRIRALTELERFGFVGEVETAEYHYIRGWLPTGHEHGAFGALSTGQFFQVGSVARGEALDLGGDLMSGFAAGAAISSY